MPETGMPQTTPPRLSIVLIVHRMSVQAENTLHSLSTSFQQDVGESDYEVIVVENSSDDVLGAERALAQCSNARYFFRDEPSVSPVSAINFGYSQCRGPLICLMIDGARIASPRVVEQAIRATRGLENPLIVVPGYHLGVQEHHEHASAGHGVESEQQMLNKMRWKKNGYDLFNVSCLHGGNSLGPLGPYLESNCLFCTRESFEAIGRADERFDLPGGGSVNIHIYHALAKLPGCRLVVLAGEGTFHQFHGGVTTAEVTDREAVLDSHRKNLREINGGQFKGSHLEPLVFGQIPPQAAARLRMSAELVQRRFDACRERRAPMWSKVAKTTSASKVSAPSKPSISFIVPDSGQARDLENTLSSLSPDYQKNVDSADYEVVVLQSRHDRRRDSNSPQTGRNVRIETYDGADGSCDAMMRFALSRTQSPLVCPLLEGMPVVTPRLVEHMMRAMQMFDQPLIAVPSYRFRAKRLALPLPSSRLARKTLQKIEWKRDGYELFAHARFESVGNSSHNPLLVSPYAAFPRSILERICGEEQNCVPLDGGATGEQLVLLAGEGAFAQSESSMGRNRRRWNAGGQSEFATTIQQAIANCGDGLSTLGTIPGHWYRLLSEMPTFKRCMAKAMPKAA